MSNIPGTKDTISTLGAVEQNEIIKDLKSLNLNIDKDFISSETQKNGNRLESAVSQILEKHSFNKLNISTIYIEKKNYHHLDDGLYYIHQPYGSQNSPDFILVNVSNGFSKTLNIECKTGKNIISWNDGFPEPDTLYIFYCMKFCKTNLFVDTDLVNDNVRDCKKKSNDIIKNANSMLREKLKDEKWYPTIRSAWNSSDINNITNKTSSTTVDEMMSLLTSPDFKIYKRGISLFSGAGGDTLGMELAGVKVIGFVEKNKTATLTHHANFPNSILIGSDVTTLVEKDSGIGKYKNKLDFLFGGFPCQSFSQGGKKDIRDPRGQLYIDFVRITELTQPTWVIGENVKGITKRVTANGECMADIVVEAFRKIGYFMIYKEVNAKDFGTPQDRKRIIFVGCKHPININIPLRTPLRISNNGGESRNKTLRDILEYSLENASPVLKDKHKWVSDIPEDGYVSGGLVSDKPFGKPPTNLTKCLEQLEEKDNISYGSRSKSTYSCCVNLENVSRTLLCTYSRMPRLFVPIKNIGQFSASDSDNGTETKKDTYHGIYIRPYTTLECKRIQGFPDSFEFKGTDIEIITQIGNAVPPTIIKAVIEYLLLIPKAPPTHYVYTCCDDNLNKLIECLDELTIDTDTKIIKYKKEDNTIETGTVWDCSHPSLEGDEKYEWSICDKTITPEYDNWLKN
jgi:DNA (cytosine-5)-methyltransferase 1